VASITKRPTSRFWVACFTDRTGRRLKRSTRETDRKAAERIANAYELAAQRLKTSRQIRKVISDLHKEITGEALTSLTFRGYSELWLARKKPLLNSSSYAVYDKSCRKFIAFLGNGADRDIAEVTREQLNRFRNEQLRVVAPRTVNHDLKHLGMLFRDAKEEGYVIDNPNDFVKRPKNTSGTSIRRPFTIRELKLVLDVATPEWQSLIKFGLYTGQRLADLASLTWSNVDMQRGEIRLVTRKRDKMILVPIAGPLRKHILSLPRSDDRKAPIHPESYETIEREDRSATLSNQFADMLAAVGLRRRKSHEPTGKKGRNTRRDINELSFHSLRHTAVSLLKDAGVPEAVVMEMVGHDSEQMSAHYTHVGREALEKAAEALPEI
jgi:integrase